MRWRARAKGKEFFRGDKIAAGVQGRGDLVGVPIVPFAAVEHQPIGHRGKRLAGAWEKLCEQDLRANVALVGIGALGPLDHLGPGELMVEEISLVLVSVGHDRRLQRSLSLSAGSLATV